MIEYVKKIALVAVTYAVLVVMFLDRSLAEAALTGVAIGIALVVMDKFSDNRKVDAEVERMKKLAKEHKRN